MNKLKSDKRHKKRHHKGLAKTTSLNYQCIIESSERAASLTVDPTGQLLPALSWLSIRASLTVFAYFPIKSKARKERTLFIKQIIETRHRSNSWRREKCCAWLARTSVSQLKYFAVDWAEEVMMKMRNAETDPNVRMRNRSLVRSRSGSQTETYHLFCPT